MSQLAYLLGAVALSALGALVLWLRHRKPKTFMSSIQEFQREMGALGGEPEQRRPTRIERPEPIMPAPEQGDLARKLKDARRRGYTEAANEATDQTSWHEA